MDNRNSILTVVADNWGDAQCGQKHKRRGGHEMIRWSKYAKLMT